MKKRLIIGCACFVLALSAIAQSSSVQHNAPTIQSPALELPQSSNAGLEVKSSTAAAIGAPSTSANTDNTSESRQNTAASLPATKISIGKVEDEKE